MEYSDFDNLDSFPLTIDNQKPIILDFILICIGCRPNSACNIYIGVLFLKLIICLRKSLRKFSIIWLFSKPHISQPFNAIGKITWSNKNTTANQLEYQDYESV